MDGFTLAFERVFAPGKKVKIQCSMELINYQPTEIIELESKRVWMAMFTSLNVSMSLLRLILRMTYLMKRVIVNGMTGSSWRFKRFERISIVVTNVNKKSIVSS